MKGELNPANRSAEEHDVSIRVWFGRHVVADYVAPSEMAQKYRVLTEQRFRGLRVTVEPLDPYRAKRPAPPLPPPLWWEMPPR